MSDLSEKQTQILSAFLRFLVLLGGIAYVPSLIACIRDNLFLLAVIDTFAFAVVIVIAFHRGISYRIRLWITVIVTLFIGGAVLFTTGNDGAGHLWLICSVVISSLFGRLRIMISTIALSEVMLLAYGLIINFGIIDSSVTVISLLAISSNLLVISIALSLIIHRLLQSLETELKSKEIILQLLHHRVRNNLQTVESLIALENEPGKENQQSRLSRRVAAVSAANNLILSEPADPSVLLQDLLQALIRPGIDKIEAGSDLRISPEKAPELAVTFSDLISVFPDTESITVDLSQHNRVLLYVGKSLRNPSAVEKDLNQILIHLDWVKVLPEANMISVKLSESMKYPEKCLS